MTLHPATETGRWNHSPTLTMKNKPPVNVGDSPGLIHEAANPDYNMIDPELLARWQDKV